MKRYLVLQLHNTYINHMNKNIVCTFAYGTNHLLQSKLITNRYLQKKIRRFKKILSYFFLSLFRDITFIQ